MIVSSGLQFSLTRLFGLTAVAAGLVMFASLSEVAVWDGHFQLTLNLRCDSALQQVFYLPVSNLEVAEAIRRRPDVDAESAFELADRDGDSYVATIRCSGRANSSIASFRTQSSST